MNTNTETWNVFEIHSKRIILKPNFITLLKASLKRRGVVCNIAYDASDATCIRGAILSKDTNGRVIKKITRLAKARLVAVKTEMPAWMVINPDLTKPIPKAA